MLFQNSNACYEYLLIVHFIRNQCSIMWCYSEHSAQINLLVVIVLWISACQNKRQRSIIPSVLKRSNRCKRVSRPAILITPSDNLILIKV